MIIRRADTKHQMYAERAGMDEVHIKCYGCEFLYAIPLNLRGNYDDNGGRLITNNRDADHTQALNYLLSIRPPVR
jgi:hypothetical protein